MSKFMVKPQKLNRNYVLMTTKKKNTRSDLGFYSYQSEVLVKTTKNLSLTEDKEISQSLFWSFWSFNEPLCLKKKGWTNVARKHLQSKYIIERLLHSKSINCAHQRSYYN